MENPLGDPNIKTNKLADKSILFPIPREKDRINIGIDIPLNGFDIWTAYEFSFMQKNNIPYVGCLQMRYDCNSKNIVESKSFKLYLNSFNNWTTTLEEALDKITCDLQEITETKNLQVTAYYYNDDKFSRIYALPYKNDKKFYIYLENECQFINNKASIKINLGAVNKSVAYFTNCLRSNCKVTKQPDWGSAYMQITGEQPTLESLLSMIVSFRNKNHFHEEISERIVNNINQALNPKELIVILNYTRRGGIDITPVRSINAFLDMKSFKLERTSRQ